MSDDWDDGFDDHYESDDLDHGHNHELDHGHTMEAHATDAPLTHDDLTHGEDGDHHVLVGDPEGDKDYWHLQETKFNCAAVQQQGILEAFSGKDFSQVDLTAQAIEHHLMSRGEGTSLPNIGKLLNYYGIETHSRSHASIGDLLAELSQKHKIIVGVHGDTPDHSLASILGTSSPDKYGHALWVTGLDVDVDHPDDTLITVNDSSDPHGAGKVYSLNKFKEMWGGTDFFYVATDEAPGDISIHDSDSEHDSHEYPEMVSWVKDHFPDLGSIGGIIGVASTGIDLKRAIEEKSLARKKRPQKAQQPSTTSQKQDRTTEKESKIEPRYKTSSTKKTSSAQPIKPGKLSARNRAANKSQNSANSRIEERLRLSAENREARRKSKLRELQKLQKEQAEQEILKSDKAPKDSGNVVYLKKSVKAE